MPHHQFDGLSEPIRQQKRDQMLLQHHADIIRILKRLEQRPREWIGILPHAADAFEGVTGGGGIDSGDMLQGFLATDLDAPEDPLGPPTTADMDVYQPVSGTLIYTETIEIKNYDITLSGLAGTYCKSEYVNGERQIYWLACEPSVLILLDTDGGQLLDTDGNQLLINL